MDLRGRALIVLLVAAAGEDSRAAVRLPAGLFNDGTDAD